MKTRAAVLRGPHTDWGMTELELDPPRAGEVLIRYEAAGLCHSDQHVQTGDIEPRFPLVGGHEGSCVIEEIGRALRSSTMTWCGRSVWTPGSPLPSAAAKPKRS